MVRPTLSQSHSNKYSFADYTRSSNSVSSRQRLRRPDLESQVSSSRSDSSQTNTIISNEIFLNEVSKRNQSYNNPQTTDFVSLPRDVYISDIESLLTPSELLQNTTMSSHSETKDPSLAPLFSFEPFSSLNINLTFRGLSALSPRSTEKTSLTKTHLDITSVTSTPGHFAITLLGGTHLCVIDAVPNSHALSAKDTENLRLAVRNPGIDISIPTMISHKTGGKKIVAVHFITNEAINMGGNTQQAKELHSNDDVQPQRVPYTITATGTLSTNSSNLSVSESDETLIDSITAFSSAISNDISRDTSSWKPSETITHPLESLNSLPFGLTVNSPVVHISADHPLRLPSTLRLVVVLENGEFLLWVWDAIRYQWTYLSKSDLPVDSTYVNNIQNKALFRSQVCMTEDILDTFSLPNLTDVISPDSKHAVIAHDQVETSLEKILPKRRISDAIFHSTQGEVFIVWAETVMKPTLVTIEAPEQIVSPSLSSQNAAQGSSMHANSSGLLRPQIEVVRWEPESQVRSCSLPFFNHSLFQVPMYASRAVVKIDRSLKNVSKSTKNPSLLDSDTEIRLNELQKDASSEVPSLKHDVESVPEPLKRSFFDYDFTYTITYQFDSPTFPGPTSMSAVPEVSHGFYPILKNDELRIEDALTTLTLSLSQLHPMSSVLNIPSSQDMVLFNSMQSSPLYTLDTSAFMSSSHSQIETNESSETTIIKTLYVVSPSDQAKELERLPKQEIKSASELQSPLSLIQIVLSTFKTDQPDDDDKTVKYTLHSSKNGVYIFPFHRTRLNTLSTTDHLISTKKSANTFGWLSSSELLRDKKSKNERDCFELGAKLGSIVLLIRTPCQKQQQEDQKHVNSQSPDPLFSEQSSPISTTSLEPSPLRPYLVSLNSIYAHSKASVAGDDTDTEIDRNGGAFIIHPQTGGVYFVSRAGIMFEFSDHFVSSSGEPKLRARKLKHCFDFGKTDGSSGSPVSGDEPTIVFMYRDFVLFLVPSLLTSSGVEGMFYNITVYYRSTGMLVDTFRFVIPHSKSQRPILSVINSYATCKVGGFQSQNSLHLSQYTSVFFTGLFSPSAIWNFTPSPFPHLSTELAKKVNNSPEKTIVPENLSPSPCRSLSPSHSLLSTLHLNFESLRLRSVATYLALTDMISSLSGRITSSSVSSASWFSILSFQKTQKEFQKPALWLAFFWSLHRQQKASLSVIASVILSLHPSLRVDLIKLLESYFDTCFQSNPQKQRKKESVGRKVREQDVGSTHDANLSTLSLHFVSKPKMRAGFQGTVFEQAYALIVRLYKILVRSQRIADVWSRQKQFTFGSSSRLMISKPKIKPLRFVSGRKASVWAENSSLVTTKAAHINDDNHETTNCALPSYTSSSFSSVTPFVSSLLKAIGLGPDFITATRNLYIQCGALPHSNRRYPNISTHSSTFDSPKPFSLWRLLTVSPIDIAEAKAMPPTTSIQPSTLTILDNPISSSQLASLSINTNASMNIDASRNIENLQTRDITINPSFTSSLSHPTVGFLSSSPLSLPPRTLFFETIVSALSAREPELIYPFVRAVAEASITHEVRRRCFQFTTTLSHFTRFQPTLSGLSPTRVKSGHLWNAPALAMGLTPLPQDTNSPLNAFLNFQRPVESRNILNILAFTSTSELTIDATSKPFVSIRNTQDIDTHAESRNPTFCHGGIRYRQLLSLVYGSKIGLPCYFHRSLTVLPNPLDQISKNNWKTLGEWDVVNRQQSNDANDADDNTDKAYVSDDLFSFFSTWKLRVDGYVAIMLSAGQLLDVVALYIELIKMIHSAQLEMRLAFLTSSEDINNQKSQHHSHCPSHSLLLLQYKSCFVDSLLLVITWFERLTVSVIPFAHIASAETEETDDIPIVFTLQTDDVVLDQKEKEKGTKTETETETETRCHTFNTQPSISTTVNLSGINYTPYFAQVMALRRTIFCMMTNLHLETQVLTSPQHHITPLLRLVQSSEDCGRKTKHFSQTAALVQTLSLQYDSIWKQNMSFQYFDVLALPASSKLPRDNNAFPWYSQTEYFSTTDPSLPSLILETLQTNQTKTNSDCKNDSSKAETKQTAEMILQQTQGDLTFGSVKQILLHSLALKNEQRL